MKIVLGCPYITKTSEKSRVCCDISGILNMSLWYEVDRNYEQYLCTERIDAFIRETLELIRKKKKHVPIGSRTAGVLKIIKNGFKRGNPVQITYRP